MPLYPYQALDASFLASRRAALLWGDPGVGKTATAVVAAVEVDAQTVLVLCPLTVVLHWQREFLTWAGIAAIVVTDAADIRPGRVLILNPDKLHNTEIRTALARLVLDVLILDENQQFKNPAAKRTRYVLGSAGLVHRARHIWLLSGTPCPQGPIDLHTPISVLWPEVLNGLSRDEFIAHYHVLDRFGGVIGVRRMKDLQQRLAPHVQRRRIEECGLPELTFTTLPLPQSVLHLQGIALGDYDLDNEAELEALIRDEAMHLSTLRAQLAAAKAPLIANAAGTELFNSADKKLVIFSWHLKSLDILEASLSAYTSVVRITGSVSLKARDEAVRQFQIKDSKTRILLAQGDAGGLGITLTAASECWFVDCPWTPSNLLQAAKRLHRIGQTKPVVARIYTVDGSIDDAVTRVILKKTRMITALQPDAAEQEIRIQ